MWWGGGTDEYQMIALLSKLGVTLYGLIALSSNSSINIVTKFSHLNFSQPRFHPVCGLFRGKFAMNDRMSCIYIPVKKVFPGSRNWLPGSEIATSSNE